MKVSYQWILYQLDRSLLMPLKCLKWRYIPLLTIYFAYGLQGFSSIALSFWQKEALILSTDQLIAISVWVTLPWTLKMVVGQFVDCLPLFGSRRKVYIYIGALFMTAGSIVLGGLAGRYDWIMWIGDEYTLYLMSALLSVIGFVIQDVTADTMTTEVVDREVEVQGKIHVRNAADIQSELTMVQLLGRIALSIAFLCTAGLGGYLAQNFSYEYIFFGTLVIPIISVVGTCFLRLSDTQKSATLGAGTPKKLRFNKTILGMGAAFAIVSLLIGMSGVNYGQEILFFVSLLILSSIFYLIIRNHHATHVRIIVMTLIGLFVYRAMPSIGPGYQWWAIDVLGFDAAFFGVLAQIGAFTGLAVLWIFSHWITKNPIRMVLLFLIIAEVFLSIPDIGLYYGVHEYFNIEARTVALFDTALESPLAQISMVPLLSLIAFYAPLGMRGTWFAVGTSFMNLALTAGSLGTKYLNKIFVVTRETVDANGTLISTADYSWLGHLMIVVIVLSFVVPMLAVVFLMRSVR